MENFFDMKTKKLNKIKKKYQATENSNEGEEEEENDDKNE